MTPFILSLSALTALLLVIFYTGLWLTFDVLYDGFPFILGFFIDLVLISLFIGYWAVTWVTDK